MFLEGFVFLAKPGGIDGPLPVAGQQGHGEVPRGNGRVHVGGDAPPLGGVEGRGHLVIAEALLLLIPWPVVPQLGLQGLERS